MADPDEDHRPHPRRSADGQPSMLRPLAEAVSNNRMGITEKATQTSGFTFTPRSTII